MIGKPMLEITHAQLSILMIAVWLAVRGFFALKHRRVEIKRELLLLTVLAFNLVGDGLRDAFDPKMKR